MKTLLVTSILALACAAIVPATSLDPIRFDPIPICGPCDKDANVTAAKAFDPIPICGPCDKDANVAAAKAFDPIPICGPCDKDANAGADLNQPAIFVTGMFRPRQAQPIQQV